MSRRPIALSPDLLRLQNEGYSVDIAHGYLLVRDVPYVDANRTVQRGTLISRLDLAGDVAQKPGDHVAYWSGAHPCHSDGRTLAAIANASPPQELGPGLRADFTFSAKADYRDYHHKMTTYIGRISGEAAMVDSQTSARMFAPIADNGTDSVFRYVDTATSRAGIGTINNRVAGQRVGIIGLGGSGSYVLDLVAKTAVAEIHLFDADDFSQHNAFRAPGAPTIEALQLRPKKAPYFAAIYGAMHKGIHAHDCYIDAASLHLLDGLDVVFLCLDRGEAKRAIVDSLIVRQIPFIEVGLGVVVTDGQLGGIVRVSTGTPQTYSQSLRHLSFAENVGMANEYATNIQIAELNALNAALAVIKWKKLFGIYRDASDDYYSGFSIALGELVVKRIGDEDQEPEA